ncbi:hypothetical protein ACHAXT_000379 [Thalassiosira profunda]
MTSSDDPPPSSSSSHPGTSGRSPAPPRTGPAVPSAGRPSLGASAASSDGRPSLLPPARLSYGSAAPSAVRGARLSYGGSVAAGGGGVGGVGGGMPPLPTPAGRSAAAGGDGARDVLSPPSTSSTGEPLPQGNFFAALSPATAKFLQANDASGAGGDNNPISPSQAAAAAVQAAANAARGIDGDGDADMDNDGGDGNDAGNANERPGKQPPTQASIGSLRPSVGSDVETARLRAFVQSLLGTSLPASSPSSLIPALATPDPASAAFFAASLLAKTATTINGQTRWRPDDAYLAARAYSLTGAGKRAVWTLDRAGLIGFGMGVGEASNGWGEGDASAGTAEWDGQGGSSNDGGNVAATGGTAATAPTIGNEEGIRNALLLRAEAALLAGQCLAGAGEHERALAVYAEAMRYPPPPPPMEWGMCGYGYRLDGGWQTNGGEEEEEEDDEGEGPKFAADETYLRAWREQSLSRAALIDEGDDPRLLQLAAHLRPLPFADGLPAAAPSLQAATGGIHPLARLCAARGRAHDATGNPHRAVPFLKAAAAIDPRCTEAVDYVVGRRLLTPAEERAWVASIDFGGATPEQLAALGIEWLRDAYLARLRGDGGRAALPLPPTATEEGGDNIPGASPVPRSGLQSPSVLSLGSPDFAGGATGGDNRQSAQQAAPAPPGRTVDEAFRHLSLAHGLGRSPDVLSRAAARSYAAHDLPAALAHCAALDAVDPYCRTAGYVHVATLVGLNLRRRLFQLAHRLVDDDPKDALSWFAVGSYYYACRRYDLAQRHFSRSTRLDPGCAEGWIGFGCSFAVCDESDQALASFRAAQAQHAGGHVPLLYMGMEYLRTNHLSLAGHFLTSAQRADPSDALGCNELGVWSYRRGEWEDAAFWFERALRLRAAAGSSALTSDDAARGAEGYVLLRGRDGEGREGPRRDASAANAASATPYVERTSNEGGPPVSTILCAVQTPSGQSVAASLFDDAVDGGTTDRECIGRIQDAFWEPTVFNLGQSYRKLKRYGDAIMCFEKCSSLNPGNYAAYAALGFAKHLGGDVDGAIDSYHEALGRKPEDPFASEMLARALAEAVTYPPSLAMLSSLPTEVERKSGGIGSSILKKLNVGSAQPPGVIDRDTSQDVDMSLA